MDTPLNFKVKPDSVTVSFNNPIQPEQVVSINFSNNIEDMVSMLRYFMTLHEMHVLSTKND